MQNFTHSRYSKKQEKYFPKCFESGFTSWGDAHTCKCESIILVWEGGVLVCGSLVVAILAAEILNWDSFEK